MADSESLESSESFTSFDSISNLSTPDLGDAIVDDTASLTSGAATAGATEEAVANKKSGGGLFSDFNIFNAMLMASLIFILLATFFLFLEVGDYGGVFGSPWRTGSVGR